MAEILVEELTTETLNGDGTFDKLMRSVAAHLREEHSNDRILSNDYSKVYLGALEASMNQSLQFILQRQQADKQAELLGAQARLVEVEILGAEKDNQLKDKQIQKIDAEISLLGKQEEKIDQEILLAEQQVLNMIEQVKKTAAEVRLIDQNILNAQAQNRLLTLQGDKLTSEKALLDAKVRTEKAQTYDIVDGSSVSGIIGKQRTLYEAQKNGFSRDAEQKLAKILVDTWSVRKSTDPDATQEDPAGLGNDDISSVLAIAKAGINAS